MKFVSLISAAAIMTGGSLMATPVNITVYDNNGYAGSGVGYEDNETEPGTVHSDAWDLEAFGYDGSSRRLDVIGTYDFANGVVASNVRYTAGAIFIGTGATRPAANGWSYAYLLDFVNGTYALYNTFTIRMPTDISASSPWSIVPPVAAGPIATGSFTYLTGLSNPDGFGVGVMDAAYGNQHRMIELSLTDLPGNILNDFYVHTTMQCGNDDLEGRFWQVPDVGGTISLMGMSLTGLLLARRKFRLS